MRSRLEVLEREHAEFYKNWHDERIKREAAQREIERLRAVVDKLCDEERDRFLRRVGSIWLVDGTPDREQFAFHDGHFRGWNDAAKAVTEAISNAPAGPGGCRHGERIPKWE
jgi:hypothetical protein